MRPDSNTGNTVAFDVEEAMERLQDPQVQEEIKAIINGEDDAEC